MKCSPDEVEILQCLVEDPIYFQTIGTHVFYWASQMEYGPAQRSLITKYTSTGKDLHALCESGVRADGSIDYDKNRYDGRDVADMLFREFLGSIKQGDGIYCHLPRVINGVRVVRPQPDEAA